jgi:hypothetical protein
MDGRRTITALFAVGAATMAWGKPNKPTATKTPAALHLKAVDVPHRLLLVDVAGLQKAPPSNYFTMTDERGRHYIAQSIHCDPPSAAGTRACELEIPAGYERHPLKTLELHLRGLHGRVVAASGDEIKTAWAATSEPAHGSNGITGAAALDAEPTPPAAPPDMAR